MRGIQIVKPVSSETKQAKETYVDVDLFLPLRKVSPTGGKKQGRLRRELRDKKVSL